MIYKFNVGDIIVGNNSNDYGITKKDNGTGEVMENVGCSETIRVKWTNKSGGIHDNMSVNSSHFDLLQKGEKPKPEDLTKYMVYGQGCDNKSSLFQTEEEMIEQAKKCKTDRDWSGRIFGYKLVPMFEVESRVVLKKFKDAKKNKK